MWSNSTSKLIAIPFEVCLTGDLKQEWNAYIRLFERSLSNKQKIFLSSSVRSFSGNCFNSDLLGPGDLESNISVASVIQYFGLKFSEVASGNTYLGWNSYASWNTYVGSNTYLHITWNSSVEILTYITCHKNTILLSWWGWRSELTAPFVLALFDKLSKI